MFSMRPAQMQINFIMQIEETKINNLRRLEAGAIAPDASLKEE